MNVCYISDANYFWPMMVSAGGLLKREASGRLIIIDCGLTDGQKESIGRALAARRNWQLSVIPWTPATVEMTSPHINSSAFALLHLDRLLPDELGQVLVIDPDTIVKSSPGALLETLRNSKTAIAGCRDQKFYTIGEAFAAEIVHTQRLDPEAPFLNSGFLFLHLDLIRKSSIFQDALALKAKLGKRLWGAEQQPLNCILNGNWEELDWSWNGQSARYADRHNAKIMHITGSHKPWRGGLRSPWWREYYGAFLQDNLLGTKGWSSAVKQMAQATRHSFMQKKIR